MMTAAGCLTIVAMGGLVIMDLFRARQAFQRTNFTPFVRTARTRKWSDRVSGSVPVGMSWLTMFFSSVTLRGVFDTSRLRESRPVPCANKSHTPPLPTLTPTSTPTLFVACALSFACCPPPVSCAAKPLHATAPRGHGAKKPGPPSPRERRPHRGRRFPCRGVPVVHRPMVPV